MPCYDNKNNLQKIQFQIIGGINWAQQMNIYKSKKHWTRNPRKFKKLVIINIKDGGGETMVEWLSWSVQAINVAGTASSPPTFPPHLKTNRKAMQYADWLF